MSIVIMTGFDTDQQSDYVSVAADDGFSIITANITGTLFSSVSGTVDTVHYASAIDDLVVKLNILGGSWTGGYLFNENKFFLSSSSGFKTTMNSFTKRLFGFEDSPTAFVQYTTSSIDPWFVFIPEESGRSKDTEVFENEVPYREAVSDDGRTFSVTHEGNNGFSFLGANNQDGFMVRDWTFRNEPIWRVFSQYSSSQTPYTWEEHIKGARSYQPWIMFDYNSSSVGTYEDRHGTYRFRGSDSNFKPTPMFRQQSQYWDVDVKTRQISRGTNFGLEPFDEDDF